MSTALVERDPTAPAVTAEHWRPVVGFEGWYEISSIGRVRRVGRGKAARVGRILRPAVNHPGYLYVHLSRHNVQRNVSIHRAVAEAFIGPCPTGMELNHKDCDKKNNRPGNLEWVTRSRNTQHAHDNGCFKRGGRS